MSTESAYAVPKRAVDAMIALIALVVLAPLLIFIAIAVCVDSAGPALFRQQRVGKGGSIFKILKFRTMRIDAPSDVATHMLAGADSHITRVGRVLRSTSLDELPQLVNILAGQMSLVGPRPALWNQYDLIAERDKCGANAIRPGLTGWAQVNGRDELPIAEKARLDGEYVRRMGPKMDLVCIWRTIRQVMRREGVVEGADGLSRR